MYVTEEGEGEGMEGNELTFDVGPKYKYGRLHDDTWHDDWKNK
jgi:hypothetical protein